MSDLGGSTTAGQIPEPQTEFIERGGLVNQASEQLLDEDHRLVILKGPAGIGKTRIAIEVANRWSQKFNGRVTFVKLAVISDSGQVIPTIARDMSISGVTGEPIKPRLIR